MQVLHPKVEGRRDSLTEQRHMQAFKQALNALTTVDLLKSIQDSIILGHDILMRGLAIMTYFSLLLL